MGSPGKHRPETTPFRTLIITAAVTAAALAAGALTFISTANADGDPEEASAQVAQPPIAAPQPDPGRSAGRATQPPPRDRTPAATKSPRTAGETEHTPKPAPRPKKSSAAKVVGSGSCEASFYWEGQATASGESFDPSELTAAHKTLPFDTRVRVTNPDNGRSVIVRINDRGPYAGGRCLDLSRAAMQKIGGIGSGVLQVKYQVLART